MKIRINKRMLLTLAVVLLVLSGCARVTGPDGKVLPEKIISLTTPFKAMFETEGWFEAIFVWPFAQLINFLADKLNVGIAIIVVTVLSRLATLALTVKSTVASQKMQLIQPELNKIQAKYAGKTDEQSKMKQSQEMMALYQKHQINPLGTIFTTFAQLPVIMALWQAVQRADSVLYGNFLGMQLDAKPLGEITGNFAGGGYAYLILIILMGIAQFASMKLPQYLAKKRLNDRDKKAAANNNQMGATTNVMFVMIMFMSITMPTAMTFYWLVSAALAALQTIYIQKRYIENEK